MKLQKYHINYVFGGNRIIPTHHQLHDRAFASCRQFHCSASRTQNDPSQYIGLETASPTPRKARIQNTTEEIQRLFERSKSQPQNLGPSFRIFKPVPPDSVDAPSSASKPFEARTGSYRAASQSETQFERQQNGYITQSSRQRVQPTQSSVVNFRSNAPRKPGFRVPRRDAEVSPRGSQSEDAHKNVGGGRKWNRNSGPTKARTIKRQRKVVKDTFEPDNKFWNAEELDYLEAKELSKIKPVATFQPKPLSQETLSGMGPALAVGEWAMTEAVQEKLGMIERTRDLDLERLETLARMQIKGLKADCRSRQESEALKERVQQILAGDNPQPEESHPITEEQKLAFMRQLLGGKYTLQFSDDGDSIGDIERQIHRNTSYLPEDLNSLLKKFRKLLPTRQATTATAKKLARAV